MTINQEFQGITEKTDELRGLLGVDEKDAFSANLLAQMQRASFDGDMSLPVDMRIAFTITALFSDADELRRLQDRINREIL